MWARRVIMGTRMGGLYRLGGGEGMAECGGRRVGG